MKFAECMRENGVREFPDPDASGDADDRWDSEWLVAGPEHRGVEEGHRRVQGPAATGVHRAASGAPRSRSDALEFAQCMRDNGVKDFPDPAQDGPLIDTNRIPSAAGRGGMEHSGVKAAMEKCGDLARQAQLGGR